jgi:RNA polymerase sigma factor (sigma-70 family)
MAAEPLRIVVHHLRKLAGAPAAGGVTDGQLLERFVEQRDQTAFELLVRRHERMVWGICRRLLPGTQDAEDAFQAAFLVLVRKARTVAKGESIASWLYKVTYRVALEARDRRAKLASRERQCLDLSWAADPHATATELGWGNLRSVLDQEINRLPEKYRAPFVLCYLEGQNYEEAAQRLGCPKGTVSTRLTRARELLRARLARRGLEVTTGMLTAAFSQEVATSSVPAALVGSTIKAGSLLTTGKAAGALSGEAFALAQGVTNAMFVTKLKIAVVFALSLTFLAGGASLVAHQTWGAKERNKQRQGESRLATKAADRPSAQSNAQGRGRTDGHGDPLPPGALARLGTVRFRPGHQIQALAYSPDGKTIASGGTGGTIFLWDAASGKPCGTLVGHKAYVFSLAYSADGKRLVSTGSESMQPHHNEGKLVLWDLAVGRPLFTVNHPGWVRTAALSADGRMVAMGCDDGTFRLLDAATGNVLHDFGKPTGINGLAFSPDSRFLAGPGPNNTIQLWDTATRHEHMRLQGPSWLRALAFSPDGKSLASAHYRGPSPFDDDASIFVWDVATGIKLSKATRATRFPFLSRPMGNAWRQAG